MATTFEKRFMFTIRNADGTYTQAAPDVVPFAFANTGDADAFATLYSKQHGVNVTIWQAISTWTADVPTTATPVPKKVSHNQ